MPDERTPLELAREAISDRPSLMPELTAEVLDVIATHAANACPGTAGWRGSQLAYHIRRLLDHAHRTIGAGLIAAALVEKCTPLLVEAPELCPHCYGRCLEPRRRPKFCSECGGGLLWTK